MEEDKVQVDVDEVAQDKDKDREDNMEESCQGNKKGMAV